ncbi:MAG: cellulase family glycosylhydrolase [Candidatus Jordarchaeaceae archaeon]
MAKNNYAFTTRPYINIALTTVLISLLAISQTMALLTSNVIIGNTGYIGYSSISPLHVEGNKIKDSAGNIVNLRGVNKVEFADDPDGIWMGNTMWSDVNVKAELDIMKSWGINVIRCHLAVEHWKYNMNQPYAAINHREAIKRLLLFAAERGIYVILDGYRVTNYWNGGDQDPLPYPPYQTSQGASSIISSVQDFINWWVSIASELKSYNNVIFELWNEPYGDQNAFQSWVSVSQQCINAIRAAGATQLIVFQWDMAAWVNLNFPNNANDLIWVYTAGLTDPLGNIVYSTHVYRFHNHIHYSLPTYLQAWNYTDIDRAFQYMKYYEIAQNYPLFIGEIGAAMTYTGTELERELAFLNNSLSLFGQRGISYAVFWWRDIGVFPLYSGNFVANQAGQVLRRHLLG